MPAGMIARLKAAENFNLGFATVEYTASALVDLEMHVLDDAEGFDGKAVEAKVLEGIGMPEAIAMRHATPHFQHVFAGDGYSAGYYSYMWSEILDADTFMAFQETSVLDKETAARYREEILSKGGTLPGMELYRNFRGRDPEIEPLLEKRGLN